MKKILVCFGMAGLICALFAGCGASRGSQDASSGESGKAVDAADPSGQETAGENGEAGKSSNGTDAAGPAGNSGQGDDRLGSSDPGSSGPGAFVYTSAEHMKPMSEPVTEEGITYQILSCEMTEKFGERKRENLEDLVAERIDKDGNLTDGSRYVFLTIQFTNTTDTEAEIYRNHGGIALFDEHYILCDLTIDAVYIDEKWTGGTPAEIFHYKLGAGESITSEIGWRVDEVSLKAGGGKLYYAAKFDDVMLEQGAAADEDAVFLQLE